MINVTKTYVPNVDRYKEYVDKIFDSGWFTNNGELVKELERKLEEYLGIKNLLLVSNGTLALQICYKLLNLSGDVITTPFSFVATTSSLCWENLNPIFVDIDKKTLNIDSKKIEEHITKQTTAILPVHVFGNACDVQHIDYLSKRYNLKVIYDGAHAFGVKYNGDSILNYGDMTTLSFHSTKIFHTIEGGAIIIKDDELYKKAKLMINFGIPSPDKIECLGINAKMNEFQAAMGLCVLEDINKIISERKKVYEIYNSLFHELGSFISFQSKNVNSSQSYSYFPIILDSEETLLNVKTLLNENGINPRRYFYPSLETLVYLNKKYSTPISSDISKRILCLPIYDGLREEDISKIVNIINLCNKYSYK